MRPADLNAEQRDRLEKYKTRKYLIYKCSAITCLVCAVILFITFITVITIRYALQSTFHIDTLFAFDIFLGLAAFNIITYVMMFIGWRFHARLLVWIFLIANFFCIFFQLLHLIFICISSANVCSIDLEPTATKYQEVSVNAKHRSSLFTSCVP